MTTETTTTTNAEKATARAEALRVAEGRAPRPEGCTSLAAVMAHAGFSAEHIRKAGEVFAFNFGADEIGGPVLSDTTRALIAEQFATTVARLEAEAENAA